MNIFSFLTQITLITQNFYFKKNRENPFRCLETLSELYVLSVMSVSLKTSFYATATSLITSTNVASSPLKEKPRFLSKSEKPSHVFDSLALM